MGAVDLDVVAGVGDHDQPVGAYGIEHPARELGAAGAPRQHHDRTAHSPVILMPARTLLRTLIEMISGVNCSTIRAISSGPQSTGRRPGDQIDQRGDLVLVGSAVTADQHVLVEFVLEVAQQRGADGMERGYDLDAVWRHLLRRLGRRSLPHAERARGLAADGRRQRNGRIDQQLVGLEHAP